MAGRPKKELGDLAPGSYRPSRHGPLPPEPGGAPTKPKGLSKVGSSLWDLVIATRPNVRESDGPALQLVCLWWERCVAGLGKAKKAAPNQASQLATAAAIATDKWLALAARFGLTPVDRTKLRKADTTAESPRQPAAVETRPKTSLDAMGAPT